MSELVELAERLARKYHTGQVDKVGVAYTGHLAAVSGMLAGEDEVVQAAGWLHDTIEDTEATTGSLGEDGVPDEVVSLVETLTRRRGEDHAGFVERVAHSPRAARVKIADLLSNTDPTRGHRPSADMAERYHRALVRLVTGRPYPA